MFYFIFISVYLLFILVLYLIRKKDKLISNIIKVMSIVFMVLTFINLFLPDSFVYSLSEEELVGNNYFETFIRWFRFVSFLVIPICVFFDKKIFNKIAIYFCLPIAIINIIIFFTYLPDFTTNNIRGFANIRFFSDSFRLFLTSESFRGIFFGILSLLELVILSYVLYKNVKITKFKRFKEVLEFVGTLIGIILVIIPIYVPQYLFGYTDIIFESYSISHLIWVLILIGIFILLNKIFKNKSIEDKYILVLIMSLSLLIQYNQMFGAINELTFKKMPFQLCNIGSYLIIITLLTKNKKLFIFTLIANVVGALLAISVMDVDGKGIGYLWNMHFIFEHSGVVLIPLLCLSLGLFPKLKKNDIKYVLIGFMIYFIFVLGLGTYLNSIFNKTGNDFYEANYFFMFDKEVASDLLPFVGKLFETEIVIGKFTYYPVIQSTVLFIFLSLCFGIFYLLYWLNNIKKDQENNI